jgi:hypothetical protein
MKKQLFSFPITHTHSDTCEGAGGHSSLIIFRVVSFIHSTKQSPTFKNARLGSCQVVVYKVWNI